MQSTIGEAADQIVVAALDDADGNNGPDGRISFFDSHSPVNLGRVPNASGLESKIRAALYDNVKSRTDA
jgi:hypothetical protein